ncbi:MAG: OprO/OprP family phosphate-selective porin [candidate division KSB1 bacterium]|nr:OprO/OprP family phosphate-selective porin [candidate division KSB1 bacterium]
MRKTFAAVFVLLLGWLRIVNAQEKKETVQVDYKDGVLINTADGRFSMRLNTTAQFQFFYNVSEVAEGRHERTPSFLLRRARILWGGNAFYPWLNYNLQLTLEGTTISVRDYWLEATRNPKLRPRAGQFKVPYNREFLTSSSRLQFVDRSIANVFAVGRDIGVMLYGSLGGEKWEYAIGAFNGAAKNRLNQDGELIYVGRAVWMPFGRFTYSQAALEHPQQSLLAIGGAVALLPDYKPRLEGSDDRQLLAQAVRATGSDTSTVFQFTVDAAFKQKGFSFEGEYHHRNLNPTAATIASVKAYGLRLQAGYFVTPKKLELALRYARVDDNTAQDDNAAWEITPAVNYYLSDHRLKLQFDLSFITRQQPGDDIQDFLGRAQVQMFF